MVFCNRDDFCKEIKYKSCFWKFIAIGDYL